jgi:serine O-acetyltransferase
MRQDHLEKREPGPISGGSLDREDEGEGQLAGILEAIVRDCTEERMESVGAFPGPSHEAIVKIIEQLRKIIYPGCFGVPQIQSSDLPGQVSAQVRNVFEELSAQVALGLRHGCIASAGPCEKCSEVGRDEAARFLGKIPRLRKALEGDVKAAFERDPAAKSLEEIVLSYPGVLAITVYRLAHELWLQGLFLVARMMSEYAHTMTGIDIHPGATIGANFFIDHGTGAVIGETTEIGDNVTLYQGVTLGGYKFRRAPDGSLERGYKRHPTVGDGVIIYAGATILGGDTVIGHGSVIGGSVWLTHSVPAGAVVTIKEPDLKYKVGY